MEIIPTEFLQIIFNHIPPEYGKFGDSLKEESPYKDQLFSVAIFLPNVLVTQICC